jgi:opacity protein-like surface antigen
VNQLLLLLFLLSAAAASAAQPIEARVAAGAIFFADDGTVTEGTVGGSVRFYFSRRWSIEPALMFSQRAVSFSRDRNTILWGNVAFDFLHRGRRVVPYWFAGPGVTHHSTRFGSISNSTTEAAFGTGGGARIHLTERIFVGPQVRIGIADGIFTEFTGSIGFVLRK